MKWRRGGSGQIEDRRGTGGGMLGGGGLPIPIGKAGGGLGLILAVVVYLLIGGLPGGSGGGFGIDPGTGGLGAGAGRRERDRERTRRRRRAGGIRALRRPARSTRRGSGSSPRAARPTDQPTTVLYEQAVQTNGCGSAPSSVGPFYCPADGKVYVDLSFFRELTDRFGAPGDFARAYVLAHEVGHHVQNLLGVSADVNRAQQEDPENANELSVRLELQADCLAGVWAHAAYEKQLLESGDLEEGLAAAAAVGDDRIQEQAGAASTPNRGRTARREQRQKWFREGFDSGDPTACDTFEGDV